MRIVKFGHACLRLEKDSGTLVIDPGAFSELESDFSPSLDGLRPPPLP